MERMREDIPAVLEMVVMTLRAWCEMMLTRDRRVIMTWEAIMALRGMFHRGETWEVLAGGRYGARKKRT